VCGFFVIDVYFILVFVVRTGSDYKLIFIRVWHDGYGNRTSDKEVERELSVKSWELKVDCLGKY
jgi:hypothetical protein